MGTCKSRRIALAIAATAAIVAALAAATISFQPAWAANGELTIGLRGTGGTLNAQDGEKTFVSPDGLVGVFGITAGTSSYNASTKTLTLNGVRADEVGFMKDGAVTINLVGANVLDVRDVYCGDAPYYDEYSGGWSYLFESYDCKGSVILAGTGSLAGEVSLCGSVTVKGGTITGDVACSRLTMSGGTVSGGVFCGVSDKNDYVAGTQPATIKGGTMKGELRCGKLTMSGGKVTGSVYCRSLLMTKGTIAGKKGSIAVDCAGAFTMKGGTITTKNADIGISIGSTDRKTYKAIISGGKIVCTRPSNHGIVLHNANLTMKGGAINITKSYGTGIWLEYTKRRGKTYGGVFSATKGAITVTVRKPAYDDAIWALKMTNKASCLKSIEGGVPLGTTFAVKGNTYQIGDVINTVILTKYGSKSTDPVFKNVKFGGRPYMVIGVGTNAFNTPTGRKVTSISIKNSLSRADAKAFAGTSALTRLKLVNSWDWTRKNGLWEKPYRWPKDSKVSKKAFAGCGASGGAGLTVVIDYGIIPGTDSIYRRLFSAKGLSSKAKIVTYCE